MIGVTEKDLYGLFGDTSVTIANRKDLSFEEKFAEAPWPLGKFPFSEEEAQKRIKSIHALCHGADYETSIIENGDWANDFFYNPLAWFAVTTKERYAAECTRVLARSINVVIFPPSPFLTMKDYWNLHVMLETTRLPSETIKILSTLHEIDHVLHPRSFEEKKIIEKAYCSEANADRFAIDYYLRHGGKKEDVRDWIHMRAIAAFFDSAPPKYWTAAACEIALSEERVPSFAEAFNPVRELQIRVVESLYGNDLSALDSKACRKECRSTVKYSENGKIKSESVWTSLRSPFFEELRKHSSVVVIEALNDVLENSKKLSNETSFRGEKIVEAYQHLFPGEVKNTFRPFVDSKVNPLVNIAG